MSEALCVDLLVRGQPQAFVGRHCRPPAANLMRYNLCQVPADSSCDTCKSLPSDVSLLQTFSVSHIAQMILPAAPQMLHQHLNQPACLRKLQQLSVKSWLSRMTLSARETLRHHTTHTSSLQSTSLHMNICQMQSSSTQDVCRLQRSIAGQKDKLLHIQT